MNTLFININGADIQSTENITVVGKPEDAIINKFYFELVKGIVKGVTVPGIGEVKKRSLVTDFEENNKEAFARITEQWELVKQVLLGENPTGTKTIILPEEYIDWLKYHSNPVYNEIAKNLASQDNAVEISIKKIYRNAIGLLVNNIDLCKEYDSFTVNDEIVDDDSAVSVDIRKKIGENVPFVPFDDYCSKEGKNPCTNNSQDAVLIGVDNPNVLFPIEGVVLGKTTLEDLKTDEGFLVVNNNYGEGYINKIISKKSGFVYYQFKGINHISRVVCEGNAKFDPLWNEYFGFSMGSTRKEIIEVIKTKSFLKFKETEIPESMNDGLYDYRRLITFFTSDNKYFVGLFFRPSCEYEHGFVLSLMFIEEVKCPYCGSEFLSVRHFFQLGNRIASDIQYCIGHYCVSCKKHWVSWDLDRDQQEYGVPMCPNCFAHGKLVTNTEDQQYECAICGSIWEYKRLD